MLRTISVVTVAPDNGIHNAPLTTIRSRALVVALVAAAILAAVPATAQTIGVFRWQLAPYCNIVAVSVTHIGNVYRLDGTDDQCGAGTRALVTGDAYLNPNGTVGFGLTVVGATGAQPTHITATATLPALNGSWKDSSGNTGAFVLTLGGGIGGNPRPDFAREVWIHAFNSMSLGGVQIEGGGCKTMDSLGNSAVIAGLDLPIGAVITEVRVRLSDSSPTSSMSVALYADDRSEASFEASQPLMSADGPPTTVPLVLTSVAAVPVSSVRSYHIEAFARAHTGGFQYCGAIVRYTLP